MGEELFDFDSDDIPELTPHDRLRAVAVLFAAGISRLQTVTAAVADATSEKPTVVIEKVP